MKQNMYNLDSDCMHVMNLSHSIHAVRLLTVDAILREMELYNFSKGNGGERPEFRFYSLRTTDNSPCVLIKVKNNTIEWCRGVYFSRPKNYMPQIVEFIVRQNFDIVSDMACTGVLRQKGKYYNIYDLPKGFVYNGDIDLSRADLVRLPDMSTIVVNGNYNISKNRLTSLRGMPKEIAGDVYAYKNSAFLLEKPNNIIIRGTFYNKMPSK